MAKLVAAGHANKVIAQDLNISLASVATYIRRTRAKFLLATRSHLIQVMQNPPATLPRAWSDLTPAERAIARDLVHGQTYRQIAGGRKTSVRTIAVQVRSIFAKLGASSRHELAARFHPLYTAPPEVPTL